MIEIIGEPRDATEEEIRKYEKKCQELDQQTEEQKQALHDWADGNESQQTLIPPITLKEDESKQYSVLSTQMNTFISEYSAKFYTQVLDVDTEWDNYIKQLNDMGMNDMIGIYQSALDRYNER